MPFKILIMGLPGAGKTWLAKRLQVHLECAWFNADIVRDMANDWDFTLEGRKRQSNRMKSLADFEKTNGRTVICDFVCPTRETRAEFNADIVIWLDTIDKGRYDDTNYLFEKPELVDYKIENFKTDDEIKELADEIKRAI